MDTKGTKQCFVIGPIGGPGSDDRRHADWLFQGIIQPVFQQHFQDTLVERSDKITTPGLIDSQIINRIIDSDLVIADMSRLNANAFYEMGIRHMVQKPIIHMFLTGEKIPFDVAPYRAIGFSLDHPDNLDAARRDLKSQVEVIRDADYTVENPVTRARGKLQLEEHATPANRLFLEELRALANRVNDLELRAAQSLGRPHQLRHTQIEVHLNEKAWEQDPSGLLDEMTKAFYENELKDIEVTLLPNKVAFSLPTLPSYVQWSQVKKAVEALPGVVGVSLGKR